MKKIFISSTFRDMNEERDLFHERICPELNEIARGYGESVSFCDLRWGVDTTTLESEDGSRKVLSVCLDEIDRCRPYMVVLLGERYGWIPSTELISEMISNRKNFVLEELEKSVTALEIEYGALHNSDQLQRTLFYFRQIEGSPTEDYLAESELHAERLNDLKRRIAKIAGGHVKTYTVKWDEANQCVGELDDFAEMVIADLRGLMEKEWQAMSLLTPYEKDLHSQWESAAQKGAQFTARYDLVDRYRRFLEAESASLAICGPSGSGKSTIISRLALDLKAQGNLVLPIFCGSSPLCSTAMDVLKYIVDFIETALGLTHFSAQDANHDPDHNTGLKEWKERLDEVAALYQESDREPLVILIDAVDQLLADDARDALQFLPAKIFGKVKVVVSCLDSFKIARDFRIEDVPDLNKEDREMIVKGILSTTGKSLSEDVIQAIAKKDGGDKPLYLSLLVSRLEMMDRDDFEEINRQGGGIDAINRKQIEIIESCPAELDILCVELFRIAARKLENEIPFTAAKYIAMSRYGLRESDLEGIFLLSGIHWDTLSFSRFRLYMSRFFIQHDDDRWDFTHKSFRNGFNAMPDEKKGLHEMILKHFRALDEKDDIRVREIMYHCIMADDRQYFVDYVKKHCMEDNVTTDKDDGITEECARENVAFHILEKDESWICTLLQDTEITGKTHELYAFLLLDVLYHLPETFQVMSRTRGILESVIANKEELLKTSRGHVLLDLSYHLLGKTYMDMGGMENFECAEMLMKQAMADMDTDWESVDDEMEEMSRSNKKNLLYMYCHLSNLYITIGDQKKLETALELLFEALDRAEKLLASDNSASLQYSLADIYSGIASVYGRLDTKYSREAISYCEKACEIAERLSREGREVNADNLSKQYEQMIILLSYEKDEESLARAFELANKSVALSEEMVRIKGDLEALERYAGSHESLAGLYVKRGDEESLKKAIELMKKAIAAQENVNREKDTESSMTDLAAYLFTAGGIYCKLGGKENIDSGYDMYLRGIKLTEHWASRQDTPVTALMLASGYMKAGEIQEMLGQDENLAMALEYYRKAIAASESVVNARHTKLSFSILRGSLGMYADLKEKMGCAEEMLDCLLKRAETERLCIEKYHDSDWVELLATDLKRICNLCIKLKGKWYETALELYHEQLRLNEQWSGQGLALYRDEEIGIINRNIEKIGIKLA